MSATNKPVTAKQQRGSTLIEVLAAATVIALALTAASAMTAMSVKVAENNERYQLALQKAEEALELVRRERLINSWQAFHTAFTQAEIYCFNQLPAQLSELGERAGACVSDNYLVAANYNFVRQVEVEVISAEAVLVKLELSWQDGNKPKSVEVEQRFDRY